MKVKEFIDSNGDNLIVAHRKSAVFFLRRIDLSVEGYVFPFWKDKTPAISRQELDRVYVFSEEVLKDLCAYLEEVAKESWKNFEPKDADSCSSDYFEYYDRDFDNNGYLRLGEKHIRVEGPSQKKTDNEITRLYKFNKRKFESFMYDLGKKVS